MEQKSQLNRKVSVVVPVKNGATQIRELLDSLTKIDYDKDKFEVIIVDGNSTDGTQRIAAEYPVKLLTEEKPGLNGARNTGLRHSDGEIIAFTDFDCVVPRNWAKKIVENLQASDVGCVGGNVERYYDDFLSQYGDESLMPVMRIFKKREVLDSVKPPMHYPAGCNMAFTQEAIKKTGVFDEDIRYGFDEDEFVERVCRASFKMVLDPDVLVKHKHRSTLQNLLKQNFNYGKGLGNLLRLKGLKSTFSRWALWCIVGFASWSTFIVSLAAYALSARSLVSQIIFFAMLLLPLTALMIFYSSQTIRRPNRKYRSILAYPLIDISRVFAFMSGMIYQLLKS